MPTRRDFLERSGGLVLLASADVCSVLPARALASSAAALSPSAWLEVTPGDIVRVFVSKSEMGQGIATGFVTIVADELDARLDQVDVVFPVADESFDDPVIHVSITGGSLSAANMYPALRRAGATARAMLIAAAARRWNVDPVRCGAGDGVVTGPDGRKETFGALAADAATMPVPRRVSLKDPKEFRYIGKRVGRVDIPAKVDGSAQFGIDVRLPGMLYATVVHAPVFGARLAHVDESPAKEVPGVRAVFPIAHGVAVVADNTWAAFAGARRLKPAWDDGRSAKLDSDALFEDAERIAAGRKVKVARKRGKPGAHAARVLSASYRGPFLAHAAMEPNNATALVSDGRCTVWAPTQVQSAARNAAAAASGVPVERVEIHTTYLGGAFGRHLHVDNVREVCEIARRMPGVPVKMTATREDDVQHDYYRPMAHSEIRAGLDDGGRLLSLEQTVVLASAMRGSMRRTTFRT
jgi:CO/xanthine dehydrogenase Mo-binding subunit